MKITFGDPAELKPRTRNPRTHSGPQIKQIATSIEKFGFVNAVLIDSKNGIIAGHGRKDRDGKEDRAEGAATGGGLGAIVGGAAGAAAGLGMIAIPGIGPVVAAAGWPLWQRVRLAAALPVD